MASRRLPGRNEVVFEATEQRLDETFSWQSLNFRTLNCHTMASHEAEPQDDRSLVVAARANVHQSQAGNLSLTLLADNSVRCSSGAQMRALTRNGPRLRGFERVIIDH